jgi:hypothetical protein
MPSINPLMRPADHPVGTAHRCAGLCPLSQAEPSAQLRLSPLACNPSRRRPRVKRHFMERVLSADAPKIQSLPRHQDSPATKGV